MENQLNNSWQNKAVIAGIIVLILIIGTIVYYTNSKQTKNAAPVVAEIEKPSMPKNPKGALIKTSAGDIEIEFLADKAPETVKNFIILAKQGFYDQTKFHRVIPDFMIQGGDPNSKGNDESSYGRGGPGYYFADEISDEKLVKGIVAMANSGPNTNGSQFFIITATETPWLQGKHTAFAKVISGMDIAEKISQVATKNQEACANPYYAGPLPCNVPVTPIVVEKLELK